MISYIHACIYICAYGIIHTCVYSITCTHTMHVYNHLYYVHISALALKWPPDKKIDKSEESSQMMQKINDDHDACDKKLSGAVEQPQQFDSNSDSDTATPKGTQKTQKERKEQSKNEKKEWDDYINRMTKMVQEQRKKEADEMQKLQQEKRRVEQTTRQPRQSQGKGRGPPTVQN